MKDPEVLPYMDESEESWGREVQRTVKREGIQFVLLVSGVPNWGARHDSF